MNASGNNDRERVLASTDLVRLIGEHVQLRPKGREFAGLCPFHDDKIASFSVNAPRNYWHCFACETGGSVIDFWMKWQACDFKTAVKELAHMLL